MHAELWLAGEERAGHPMTGADIAEVGVTSSGYDDAGEGCLDFEGFAGRDVGHRAADILGALARFVECVPDAFAGGLAGGFV